MSQPELVTVLRLLASLWPNADVEARYTAGAALMLHDLDVEEVCAAIRALAVGSPPVSAPREFPPPPGVVRAKVEEAHRVDLLTSMLELG